MDGLSTTSGVGAVGIAGNDIDHPATDEAKGTARRGPTEQVYGVVRGRDVPRSSCPDHRPVHRHRRIHGQSDRARRQGLEPARRTAPDRFPRAIGSVRRARGRRGRGWAPSRPSAPRPMGSRARSPCGIGPVSSGWSCVQDCIPASASSTAIASGGSRSIPARGSRRSPAQARCSCPAR